MIQNPHQNYMALALAEAEKGLYTTHPNPRVGCIITKDDRIIARGHHHKAGQPHAEIIALHHATAPVQGGTVYVTLEPCCHHGRTPPCTEALIRAGIKKVYIAVTDPNPRVQNNGIAALKTAGIEVHVGLLPNQAQQLNPGYWQRHTQGRPLHRVKLAISLDGRTTCMNQHTKHITSPAARQDVQHWRALSSAIITGINTIITDNPQLNVRNLKAKDTQQADGIRQPDLFIIDNPALTIPPDAKIFQNQHTISHSSQRKIYLVTGYDYADRYAKLNSKLHILKVPYQSTTNSLATDCFKTNHPLKTNHLDIVELSRIMGKMDINEVLIEAGQGISSQYIQSGLTDQLILYQAPKLFGDQEKGMITANWQHPGINLRINSITPFDQDVRYIAEVITGSAYKPVSQIKSLNQIKPAN